MTDLHKQLAGVFAHGVAHSPELAHHLHSALSQEGDGGKSTKAEANYRMADSDTKSCGTCEHYSDTASCDVVSGIISADHVSDLYQAKHDSKGSKNVRSSVSRKSRGGGDNNPRSESVDSSGSSDSSSDSGSDGSYEADS